MAATLQRKSSGGIIFVIITKLITKENIPRNYFVIISARMVMVPQPLLLSFDSVNAMKESETVCGLPCGTVLPQTAEECAILLSELLPSAERSSRKKSRNLK